MKYNNDELDNKIYSPKKDIVFRRKASMPT